MELKKCKKCGTTENVKFDGMCKKCYEDSIIIEEKEGGDDMENKTAIYKKWWFWLIIIFILVAIGQSNSTNTTNISNTSTITKNETSRKNITSNNTITPKVEVIVADFSTMPRAEIQTWFTTNKINGTISDDYSSDIPKGNFVSQSIPANTKIYEGDKITVVYSLGKAPTIEEKNALKKAESYSNNLHMSKAQIYKQLTSDYGEGFTESAAQYAIDNINADWNANALAKAKSYQSTMNMSRKSIYNQLISEYGEQFTKDEAQYAIDHLEE